MINQLLVTLVNSVLGTGKRTARGNMAYHCPYCKHHKPKLEVNFTENKKGHYPWHCWVCNKKGKSISFLLKQAGVSQSRSTVDRLIYSSGNVNMVLSLTIVTLLTSLAKV